MSSVNKVILVGNLGKDPEIKRFEGDKKVATFPLATSETYRDREGNKIEKTEWHNVVFWGPVVEVIEKYVKKGKQIYVEGRITTRQYEKDGQTRYITEVVGQNITLLGTGGSGENTSSGGYSSSGSNKTTSQEEPYVPPVIENTPDDDLPF